MSWRKIDESFIPEAITLGDSHSTLDMRMWDESCLRRRTGVLSAGNGFFDSVQWLPAPSRVCSPSEVPIAKSGFWPVGQADEHHSDGEVRIRMGRATAGVSGCFQKLPGKKAIHEGGHR